MGEAERVAIRLAARTEGLLLDRSTPGENGRADRLIRQGVSTSASGVFWHIRRCPALFADRGTTLGASKRKVEFPLPRPSAREGGHTDVFGLPDSDRAE